MPNGTSGAYDIVLMKYVGMNPVIVHGGGPEITDMQKRVGKESRFVGGLRSPTGNYGNCGNGPGGKINKEIVTRISPHRGSGRPVRQGRRPV